MGKRFSEEELQKIQKDLLAKGEKLFAKKGVRKTTVDDICLSVGIAKGSFYRFYETKEVLLLDILIHLESEIKEKVGTIPDNPDMSLQEKIIQTILAQFNAMHEHPILIMISQPDEFMALTQKLPKKERAKLTKKDDETVTRLLGPEIAAKRLTINDPYEISAILRGLFIIFVHQEELMTKDFDALLSFYVSSIVHGLISSDANEQL